MHDVSAGWWILMSLGMVAFWGVVIWAIWRLAGGGRPASEPGPANPETPLDILQRRLARGEISTAEYEELREALTERPRVPV